MRPKVNASVAITMVCWVHGTTKLNNPIGYADVKVVQQARASSKIPATAPSIVAVE